jgi:hypothetical protein
MAGNTLKFKAVLDDKVSTPLDKMRGKFDTLGSSKGFKSVAQGVGIGAGIGALNLLSSAIGGVTDFLGDSVAAYNEDQKSIANLDASLKANVAGWNGNRDAIEGVLTQRMALGFSDEEQRSSLAKLVAATHDVNAALEIQRTAMDLARFKGISLADATDALTKVEAGSYRVLKSLGIQLKDGATQTEALAAVQAVATGQAAAYASTNEGKVLVSQIKVNEAQEKLGKTMANFQAAILPAVAEAITVVVDAFLSLGIGVETTMDKAASAASRGSQSAEFALKRMQMAAEATANGWDASTNKIVTDVEHMRGDISKNFQESAGEASRIANALPLTVAKNLRSGYDDIKSASTALGEAMKNPIKAAVREKALQNVLNGKGSAGRQLAAGLRSADPVVRQAAIDLRHALQEELAAIREVGVHITATLSLKGGFKGGARAGGGPVASGTPYLVGEEGPELFVPGASGNVMSNNATVALARRSQRPTTHRPARSSSSSTARCSPRSSTPTSTATRVALPPEAASSVSLLRPGHQRQRRQARHEQLHRRRRLQARRDQRLR